MICYGTPVVVALGFALAACGGQQEVESAAVDTNGPAGYAGPPPGAAPEPGIGDANTVSAQPSPIAASADTAAMGGAGAVPSGPDSGVDNGPQNRVQQSGSTSDNAATNQQEPGSRPTR